MGAFRTRMCLCGRSLLGGAPICAFVSASKISVPGSSGDRFGDWVVSASARISRGFLVPCIPLRATGLVARPSGGGWSLIMLNDRENILSALREKPLKVYEIMKRANISNEEACQSLLLKMRDDGLVKFDIH
jgi:hypothetical protein